MIPVLAVSAPRSPFRPCAVLLRKPRRSPGATAQSSQIAPRQRPQQPIRSPQPAAIIPTLSCNLLTGSCHPASDHALQ